MNQTKYLKRGIDYLGDLGAKLRDLQGYPTLAYELIQNADDADATWMCLDIQDDALIVDNDGIFSDCGHIEDLECSWKEDITLRYRCDFHRFRYIAAGDKRGQAGKTGAFGIGFIAVYQITDCPELISAGRHWIIHEEQPEEERIEVCTGCQKCTQINLPGTRFILPWARNPESRLRQALHAEPIRENGPRQLQEELERSLPIAMLFLKKLRTIEIRLAGKLVRVFERVDANNSLIISDGNPKNDRIWYLVQGEFSKSACQLREKHTGLIEPKRSSQVKLAIPADSTSAGLLCACLPTEQDVGLPFHINADFFPTNDRKRVILAHDYQSAWNREALRAAAHALGEAIPQLRDLLHHKRFWELVSAIKKVADEAMRGQAEATLAEFWRSVHPWLRTEPIIYTTKCSWMTVLDSFLLFQQEEEAEAIPILEGLGVNVVHEDLRPYYNLLRELGMYLLSIDTLCNVLQLSGMDRRLEVKALPPCLQTMTGREILWREITRMLKRQRTGKKEDEEKYLRQVSIAPGRDGAFWPCKDIYRADENATTLFEELSLSITFVLSDPTFEPLAHLCTTFDASVAIRLLQNIGDDTLERAWKENRLDLSELLEWFWKQRDQINSNQVLKDGLVQLPIYPSAGRLRVLGDLALPGRFDDPLGLAELVDLNELDGRSEFLRELGMRELDFRTYAVRYLPSVLKREDVPLDKRRAAVRLLAERIGELRDNNEAYEALASTPLVECTDGEFRLAQECYFNSTEVRQCLGDNINIAVLPKSQEFAVRDLYNWLGVIDEPRFNHLVNRVRELAAHPYSDSVAPLIQKVIENLGKRVKGDSKPKELEPLSILSWLPARGRIDRWYSPKELYTAYQYFLFESQALFLDIPMDAQRESSDFLQFIGVKLTPSTPLVVKHLIHCTTQQRPVNTQVYRFLNDNLGDPSINQLKDKKCLWLEDAYRAPNEVFWGEHPFGRYRCHLSEELRSFNKLFAQLGVRDAPNHEDALSVLKEISAEFGTVNRPLDEDVHTVLMVCWRMLEKVQEDRTFSQETLLRELGHLKCIPNKDRVLYSPNWIFFENRAGLAAKFKEFLKKNVIPRPIEAGNAFAAVGVQPLSSAVEIKLLECADPTEDPEMMKRIQSRYNEISRVLGSQISGLDAAQALQCLNSIRCQAVVSLRVKYCLCVFNRVLDSNPELVHALYQRKQGTLFFMRQDGRMPWPAIARELAIALFPDEDPGRFAAGLKEALSADTSDDAAGLLDELGFAQFDSTVHKTHLSSEHACALGEDITPTDSQADISGYARSAVDDAIIQILGPSTPRLISPTLEQTSPTSFVPTNSERGDNRTSDSTIGGIASLAENNTSKTGRASGSQRAEASERAWDPDNRTSGSTRERFISYVGVHTDDEDDHDELDQQSRMALEEKGIALILQREPRLQRTPMNNPGFDLIERGADGQPARWIEVKTMAGSLHDRPVGLSKTQFEYAREHGTSYWLYIVEYAGGDGARIKRIQDPAGRAQTFTFDHGWLAIAEVDEEQEGIGE